jgi:hypothetical protein
MHIARRDDYELTASPRVIRAAEPYDPDAAQAEADCEILMGVFRKELSLIRRSHELDTETRRKLDSRHLGPVNLCVETTFCYAHDDSEEKVRSRIHKTGAPNPGYLKTRRRRGCGSLLRQSALSKKGSLGRARCRRLVALVLRTPSEVSQC